MSENNKYFLGLDEVSGGVNSGVDKGLKDEYIAHFANVLGCKTVRVWLRTNEVIKIREGDKIEFIAEGLINLHNYIEKLRRHGVERFLLLDWGFVYPYGYHATDRNVVPDPKREPEMYRRFLFLQQRVRFEIASNFSFINHFESTNEPEGELGNFLHKNGYHFDGKDNKDFVFTRDEIEDIVLDLNYFETIGVKMANKNNKMLLPSFCNFEYAPSYLDDIYNKIESGNYPTVGALKSNKVDSFFEILNWHPYNMFDTEINDYWLDTQEKLREVILKHNDADRKVWYTENGWSDFKREKERDLIGGRFVKLLQVVKEKLPWVETVFLFRLFNLANRPENEGEDNFGLVHNEFDWFNPLLPKPSIIEIYKYLYGEDASLEPLYKFCKVRERELFPYFNLKEGKGTYKVLVLGNHIAYQKAAPWNKYNESKGMDASTKEKDYPHLLFNGLKEKHPDIDMTVIDMRNWVRCFYYEKLYQYLEPFKNQKYDLVIVRLGENMVECAYNDFPFKDYLYSLCEYFRSDNTKFILTSLIDNNIKVNAHIKEVAKRLNATYVDFESTTQ